VDESEKGTSLPHCGIEQVLWRRPVATSTSQENGNGIDEEEEKESK